MNNKSLFQFDDPNATIASVLEEVRLFVSCSRFMHAS